MQVLSIDSCVVFVVPIDLVEPLLHVIERLCVSHIVDDNDAMSTTVITGGDGAETLLTSGIPLYV